MDKVKVPFLLVLLFFVLPLVVVHSEGNRKFLKTYFGKNDSWFSQDELDQETVEQLWVYCWKKISKTTPDFRLNLPYEIEKTITILPPNIQKSFLDCLTRRNLLLATPNKDPVSTTWLERLLDLFTDFSSIPRRHLESHDLPRHHHKQEAPNIALDKKHPYYHKKKQTDDEAHGKDDNLDLRKKHLHQHQKKQTDDETHEQDDNLDLGKKHLYQHQKKKTDDENHEQDDSITQGEKHPHQQQKAQKDDETHKQDDNITQGKKHPNQHQEAQTDDKRHEQDDSITQGKKHHHQHQDAQKDDESRKQDDNITQGKRHPNQHREAQTDDKKHEQDDSITQGKKHHHQHQDAQKDDESYQNLDSKRPDKPSHQHLKPRPKKRQRGKKRNITQSGQSASLALAPRPMLLEPSRTPAPAPSPVLVPAPAPIDISPKPSTPTPTPSLSPSPIWDPRSLDISQPLLQVQPPTPDASPGNGKLDTSRNVTIVSAASAVAAFIAFVALICVCCVKRGSNKVNPRDIQKDENHLLNLSLSSISGKENPKEKIIKMTARMDNSSPKFASSSPLKKDSPKATQAISDTTPAIPFPPGKKAPPPPSAPPPPALPSSAAPPSAPPPPLPKKPAAPPPPPKGAKTPPPSFGKPSPNQRGRSSLGGAKDDNGGSDSSNKAKLKPFFWDKVSPDQSMVWQDLSAGSFQVDEEMMTTLFGYTVAETSKNDERKASSATPQYIKIIDPKKSQNLSILLKALNVTTEEVCDALKEGNELPSEFIQTLLKMAPTSEEELKLRLYNGELSMLVPSERFLKCVVEIPFAFKRMESLLFISSAQEEVSSIRYSFKTLEVACTELKNSRLFFKLLEAVLKTGNRMNDGTYRGDAQAFKLDTLLKLSDVKGTDGKTTLLHFVVQEIIRSEGVRAARNLRDSQKSDNLNDNSVPRSSEYYRSLGLNVVSGLGTELENVRKAAVVDSDGVTNTVTRLGHSLLKIKNFLDNELKGIEEESKFRKKLEDFVGCTESEIERLVEEEKRIMDLVKGTSDYFYGKGAKNEGLKLFVIVRDFLVILDKACNEVKSKEKTPGRPQRKEALSPSTSSDSCKSVEQTDLHQRLFPAIKANRLDDSDDDESFSPKKHSPK